MKLRCLKDKCPETGNVVDMLRCCGAHSWSKPCKYYGCSPWSEYLYATCEHPSVSGLPYDLQDHEMMMHDTDKDALLCYYDAEKAQKTVYYSVEFAEIIRNVLENSLVVNEIEEDLIDWGVLDT